MTAKNFEKSFTQQEAISPEAIQEAVRVLQSGRLHRYNVTDGESGEVAALESAYAAYQGVKYCLATASGGTAIQIALRAVGVHAGDEVLTNAFTLAPVPGAIAAVGAKPIFVETTENLTIDLDDLAVKLQTTTAKYLLLSHMRGHLADMEALLAVLGKFGTILIEDCAHTMGAAWNGVKSGNFGSIACFSTQTYKHINSGEGGLLTTNDPELMAKATMLSGSYMLFEKHLSRPDATVFESIRFETPNCSSRMDNLRAAILLPQLRGLDENVNRWNRRYKIIEDQLLQSEYIEVPTRPTQECYVGSSFQFLIPFCSMETCLELLDSWRRRGVELKWFGNANPIGFTSRYDSWTYAQPQSLPHTLEILHRVMDVRIPLSFSHDDCHLIAKIIVEELSNALAKS